MSIAMTDKLTSKTVAWEKDKSTEFVYDGVSTLLEIHAISPQHLLVAQVYIKLIFIGMSLSRSV